MRLYICQGTVNGVPTTHHTPYWMTFGDAMRFFAQYPFDGPVMVSPL